MTLSLAERLKQHLQRHDQMTELGNSFPSAPVSEAQLTAAEEVLGFKLPTLLKDLYSNVADGGFGPGYGFRRLDDLVNEYQRCELIDWPEKLLPVAFCGCFVELCVDCASPDGRVVVFDGDLCDLTEEDFSAENWQERSYPERSDSLCYSTLASSLEPVLEAWLDGVWWGNPDNLREYLIID